MIDKIIELFDKGYCNECNELNCLGGEPSSKTIANAIRKLQQDNQQLEEQDRNNTATLVLLNDENKELKEQLKNIKFDLEYEKENLKFSKDYAECLKDKLKQRDEVIDEAIKILNDNTCYDYPKCAWLEDKELYQLLEILRRYRGDNK